MRAVGAMLAVWALAAAAAGCGDDGAAPVDAGPRDASAQDAARDAAPPELGLPSGATLALPMPPALPAPPSLEPCRAGWRAVTSPDAPTVCDPWPATGRATCPVGEAHFPGEPGCRTIGNACPATGDFPGGLPATGVLYVLASAPAGGTGTATAPFTRIGDAVTAAATTPGTLVVVGRGTYDEAVTLPAGVSLRGACARDTRIAYSTRDAAPASVRITGADVSVADVQIGGARSGLLLDLGGRATITGVLVDQATEAGLRVHRAARATLRDVVVSRTLTDSDDHLSAWGLVAELAGVATGSKIVVSGSRFGGVIATGDGAELTLDDVAVLDTRTTEMNNTYGIGLAAQHGARVTVHGIIVDGAAYTGMMAGLGGAVLDADDVVVRHVVPDTTATAIGIGAIQTGVVRVRRALVEATVHGAHTESAGMLELEDAVVRSLRTDTSVPDVDHSIGLLARGATLTATRVHVEDVGYAGVGAFEAATLHLADLRVRGNQGGLDDTGGLGIAIVDSTADVTRALVDHDRYSGVTASGPTAIVQLTDVTIEDIEPQVLGGDLGRGLQAQVEATMTVERVRIERTHANGAMVLAMATLTGSDLAIRDTRSGRSGAWANIAAALAVQGNAHATLSRVEIGESAGWGVKLDRAPSDVTLEDAWIHDIRRFDHSPVVSSTAGRGLDLIDATTTLRRAIIERARDVGIFVMDGSLDLSDVVVRDMQGDELTGEGGTGLEVSGATVTAQDLLLERNRESSLFVNSGATFTGERIRVLDTLAAACEATTCAGRGRGIGVSSTLAGQVTLTEFLVSGAALCGVQVLGGGMDLHSGRVEHCLIGANVQDASFDFARLSDRVLYVDNDRNLDSASLPVPTSAASLDVAEPP